MLRKSAAITCPTELHESRREVREIEIAREEPEKTLQILYQISDPSTNILKCSDEEGGRDEQTGNRVKRID